MKLSEFDQPGENNFGFVRLMAAIAVVYSHAFLVTLGSSFLEPLDYTTSYPLGAHAVNAFFILSGLMVAASLDRTPSFFAFGAARLLRILPALIVVVLLTFLLAVLYLTLAGKPPLMVADIAEYFVRNALMLGAGATLPGIFESNVVANEINPPLWTLKFEIFYYAVLAGVAGIFGYFGVDWRGRSRRFDLVVGLILFVSAAYLISQYVPYHTHTQVHHFARFAFGFFLGVAAWRYRDLIVVNIMVVIVAFCFAAVCTWIDVRLAQTSQMIFLALFVFWLGKFRIPRISEFVDRQDYSYGIYITGYPLQQIGVAIFQDQTPLQNLMFTLPLALLASFLLWNVIERPALGLKKKLRNVTWGSFARTSA